MAKVRLSIEVSKELAALLDSLAENEETSKTEIVRRALSVMKAYRDKLSWAESILVLQPTRRSSIPS